MQEKDKSEERGMVNAWDQQKANTAALKELNVKLKAIAERMRPKTPIAVNNDQEASRIVSVPAGEFVH